MMTARTALQTAVEANDAAGIASAATQIGTLTTQEVQTRATADAAFYALLTSTDQQAKFRQVEGPARGFGPPAGNRGPPPPDQN